MEEEFSHLLTDRIVRLSRRDEEEEEDEASYEAWESEAVEREEARGQITQTWRW